MATGASTADLAIILIDATQGVLPQSRRHAYIASLLGIPHVRGRQSTRWIWSNSARTFSCDLRTDFAALAEQLGHANVHDDSDQRARRRQRRPAQRADAMVSRPTLLEHLETVPIRRAR